MIIAQKAYKCLNFALFFWNFYYKIDECLKI